ncbi:MAG: hypothetical protein Q8R34_01645 [bacterium]|nr:hypothetical protein [bacterium]
MFQTLLSGDTCAVYGRISDPSLENLDESSLNSHRKCARILLFFTIVNVILIEVGVIVSGNAQWDLLFFIHLLFAVPYLKLLVLLNTILNGLKTPHHKLWAYACLACFIGTIFTGIPLIMRL